MCIFLISKEKDVYVGKCCGVHIKFVLIVHMKFNGALGWAISSMFSAMPPTLKTINSHKRWGLLKRVFTESFCINCWGWFVADLTMRCMQWWKWASLMDILLGKYLKLRLWYDQTSEKRVWHMPARNLKYCYSRCRSEMGVGIIVSGRQIGRSYWK